MAVIHYDLPVLYVLTLSSCLECCTTFAAARFSGRLNRHSLSVIAAVHLEAGLCITYSGTSLLRSPTGLGKSDLNGEVITGGPLHCGVQIGH